MVKRDANKDYEDWWSIKVFKPERYQIIVRSSKILGNILIERIRKAVDKELRKEQTEIRNRKRTSDQIFIFRKIIKQSVEWQVSLYLYFIISRNP